jgi:hypothetical protein
VGDREKASIDNAAAAKSQMHTRTFIFHKSVLSSPFHQMSLIDLDTALLVVEVMAPSSRTAMMDSRTQKLSKDTGSLSQKRKTPF